MEFLKRFVRKQSPSSYEFLKRLIHKQTPSSYSQAMDKSNPINNFDDNNFDEKDYLLANPDVANAVKKGILKSGRNHYDIYGKNENRKLRPSPSDFVNFRNVLRHYIAGSGIEIGALHMPIDISGLPVTSIRYVDRLTIAELKKTIS